MNRLGAGLLVALAFQCSSAAWAVRPIPFAFRQPASFASIDAYETFYEIDGYLFVLSPSANLEGATVVDSAELPASMLDEFGLPRVGGDGVVRVTVDGDDGDVYKAVHAYRGDLVSAPSNVVLDPADVSEPAPAPEPPAGPAVQDPVEPVDPGTSEESLLRKTIDAYESLSGMVLELERDFQAHLGAAQTRDEYLSGYAMVFESAYGPRLDALESEARHAPPELSKRARREHQSLVRYAQKVRKLGAMLRVAPRRPDLGTATKERLLRSFSRKVTRLVRSIDRRIAAQERRLDRIL